MLASITGSPVSTSHDNKAEDLIGKVFPHMQDNFLLDVWQREAGHMHISIEAEADRAVGPDQSLAGNRTAGQAFQQLDQQEVGRLNHGSGSGFRLHRRFGFSPAIRCGERTGVCSSGGWPQRLTPATMTDARQNTLTCLRTLIIVLLQT